MTLQHLGGRGLLLQRLARLGDQPRVLHRDHRLRREILQQRDLLVGERPHLLAIDGDSAEQRIVLAQRHDQQRSGCRRDRRRRAATDRAGSAPRLRQIGDIESAAPPPCIRTGLLDLAGFRLSDKFRECCRHASRSRRVKPLARHRSSARRTPPRRAACAFSSIASNTGARSPGEALMTCNTSAVAVCWSRASASSAR